MSNEFFQVLKKEHKELKDLLTQLDETSDRAPTKREQLFLKLRKALVPHMKAEEICFYKPLLKIEEAKDVALEAVEEHHSSELVLEELVALSKDNERWGAKLAVFKEMIEHHIKEEESTVFSTAKDSMKKEEIEAIGAQFDKEANKLKQNFK